MCRNRTIGNQTNVLEKVKKAERIIDHENVYANKHLCY
jgi:hypothetical protein